VTGLRTKPLAPNDAASASCARTVQTTTGMCPVFGCCFSNPNTCQPSICGIITSSTITSGCRVSASATASSGFCAPIIRYRVPDTKCFSSFSVSALSSITITGSCSYDGSESVTSRPSDDTVSAPRQRSISRYDMSSVARSSSLSGPSSPSPSAETSTRTFHRSSRSTTLT